MTRHRINLSGLWLFGIVISAFGTKAEAQVECAPVVGRIISVEGSVHVQHPGAAAIPVSLSGPVGAEVCAGDVITVGTRSRAAVALVNGVIERWDQNTTARIGAIAEEEGSWLDLLAGAIQFFSWQPRELTITTPFLNATVEGTEFAVRVEADRASVAVLTGRIRASNAAGSVVLAANQAAVARAGEAPQIALLVRPTDAVQWALFYPPISPAPSAPGAPADLAPLLGRVAERLQQGDVAGALDLLAADPTEPRLALYRASLLLSVGRVEEARREIDRALALDPQAGEAHALRAVIAVAQNERPTALAAGERAVALSPGSAAARIALSYALQADFRLEEARDQLLEAVRQDPGNALAQARLAELWLALGYRGRAAEAAGQAAAAAPELSRAQSMLGFTDLARLNVDEARAAFDKAITLDPGAAQAYLGRGLAKIRRGDLGEGRQELEIAASLDPSNALLRTYLGKAYYEERRSDLAERQFEIAKAADPLDPTAYLYSAINLQGQNRPVEALKDAQRSIELNDNRLVYRSRLLLEDDRAARGAGLAQIYSDLGFEQLALAEGWRSVDANPSNASAHRFLADSYSILPRHEIARTSELLQAQLRQPLNIYSVRPQLTERNLFILEDTGPSRLAYNEFNQLFARDGVKLQANAFAGTQDTLSDELVVAGMAGHLAFSAGQFHYRTEGFRPNNDRRQNSYNFFTQAQLTDSTSVQTELAYRNADYGDLPLRFHRDDFAASLRQESRSRSVRFGLHHEFSPNAEIIGNLRFEQSSYRTGTDFFELDTKSKGYQAEFQYLQQLSWLRLLGGASQVDVNRPSTFSLGQSPTSSPINRNIRDQTIYGYSFIDVPYNITLTLGVSGNLFAGSLINRNQINPKFGLTWTPIPTTTIRAAGFRTLTKTFTSIFSGQTIEPTSVAGFNQFFDDPEGADSWRYGIAIDSDISKLIGMPLFTGAEFSWRELPEVSVFYINRRAVQTTAWAEQLGRAYIYWTPTPSWAFSAEYRYEHFARNRAYIGNESFIDASMHRLMLGGRYFHPSGFRASAAITMVDQKGEFEVPGGTFLPGADRFALVDASIGYRVPNRVASVTLIGRNIFDQRFNYQNTDPVTPRFAPDRQILLLVSLAL